MISTAQTSHLDSVGSFLAMEIFPEHMNLRLKAEISSIWNLVSRIIPHHLLRRNLCVKVWEKIPLDTPSLKDWKD